MAAWGQAIAICARKRTQILASADLTAVQTMAVLTGLSPDHIHAALSDSQNVWHFDSVAKRAVAYGILKATVLFGYYGARSSRFPKSRSFRMQSRDLVMAFWIQLLVRPPAEPGGGPREISASG